jgi:conjugal transfer/entry exclusion protein
MDQFLLYSCIFVSLLSFIIACNAGVRVAKVMKSTKGLEWDDIANLTGDIATVKKTIQTLNNRMNGMHSPKIQEQELMLQLLANQNKGQANGKIIGG